MQNKKDESSSTLMNFDDKRSSIDMKKKSPFEKIVLDS
jgi:hypothetical protein